MITELTHNGIAYTINEFQLFGGGPYDTEDIVLKRRRQINGTSKWAILDKNTWCLNKDGEWEYEPIPSSRDEAYIERCRFDTPEEALVVWRKVSK